MKVIKTNILNPVSPDAADYQKNVFLYLDKGIIQAIEPSLLNPTDLFENKTDCVCLPGFIDTHVHLSQFRIRGKHSPNLLHWLNTYTFQEEEQSQKESYARQISYEFFSDLRAKGTTTAVIYTAPFKKACEIAFEVAEELDYRALIGMTMMDQNSPDYLLQQTSQAFEDSVELYEKWNQTKREYIFSPRFAPTCSRELMTLTGEFATKNHAFIQTHLAENKDEIKWVSELFPECASYTEVYQRYHLLSDKTILGHGIHLSEAERKIIKETNSKIAHCPDSNFFLKSGAFPFHKMQQENIDFALASDVGGGTTLSMMHVMQMCNYRQEEFIVSPQAAFYYATLGGAKILAKDALIGSITKNKAADLNFFSIQPDQTETEILSHLLYRGTELEIEPYLET